MKVKVLEIMMTCERNNGTDSKTVLYKRARVHLGFIDIGGGLSTQKKQQQTHVHTMFAIS